LDAAYIRAPGTAHALLRARPPSRRRLLLRDAVAPPAPAGAGPGSAARGRGLRAWLVAIALSLAAHAGALALVSGVERAPRSAEPIRLRLLRVAAESAPAPSPPRQQPAAPRPPAPARPLRVVPAPVASATARAPSAESAPPAAQLTPPAHAPPPGAPAPPTTADVAAAPALRGVRQERPHYPRAARLRGAEGVTLLRLLVAASGRVQQVEVARSAGHGDLDQAAAQAARSWRFEPFAAARDSSGVWVLVPVEFHLR
jgi:protein TonB